jgi:hypothetical protein
MILEFELTSESGDFGRPLLRFRELAKRPEKGLFQTTLSSNSE